MAEVLETFMAASKKQRIVGWIISGIVGLFLGGPSAIGKFVEWDGKAKMFEHIGFSTELIFQIGILEVVLAMLFVIPRTSFLGAILLTGYLGGATVTHLRVGDPFVMPIIIGIVMWIGLGLRRPEVFSLACGAGTSCGSNDPKQ
jgi:hypothetical protein